MRRLGVLIWGAFIMCLASTSSSQAMVCSATMTPLIFDDVVVSDRTTANAVSTLSVECIGDGGDETIHICLSLDSKNTAFGITGSRNHYLIEGATTPSFTLQSGGTVMLVSTKHRIGGMRLTSGTNRFQFRVDGRIDWSGYTGDPDQFWSELGTTIFFGHDEACQQGTFSIDTISVSARYKPSCSITAWPLDFGILSPRDRIKSRSTKLELRCTNKMKYTVSLGEGDAYRSGMRNMQKVGGSEIIPYGLYVDSDHRTLWGSATSTIADGKGSGSYAVIPIYGKIQADTDLPVGSYSDTVVVTVTYDF